MLLLSRQANGLGVAAALDIEHTLRMPDMLVVAWWYTQLVHNGWEAQAQDAELPAQDDEADVLNFRMGMRCFSPSTSRSEVEPQKRERDQSMRIVQLADRRNLVKNRM